MLGTMIGQLGGSHLNSVAICRYMEVEDLQTAKAKRPPP